MSLYVTFIVDRIISRPLDIVAPAKYRHAGDVVLDNEVKHRDDGGDRRSLCHQRLVSFVDCLPDKYARLYNAEGGI